MDKKIHVVCPSCNAVNRFVDDRLGDSPVCGKCAKHLFVGAPIELNTDNFLTHIGRNDIPVIVDFWAPWCGPCQSMAPLFTQAASQLEPRARLAKLNTEAEQAIGAKYNIRSIPTMLVFKQGKEVARQSGAMSCADIVRWATPHLT